MIRLAISSISEVDLEKLIYLQPNRMGGQAGRTWTSLAPLSNRYSVVSRSWVPRTMESSISSRLLSWISSRTGISFILAIRLRFSWMVGIKDLGQVGVYLMKGLEKGTPDWLA